MESAIQIVQSQAVVNTLQHGLTTSISITSDTSNPTALFLHSKMIGSTLKSFGRIYHRLDQLRLWTWKWGLIITPSSLLGLRTLHVIWCLLIDHAYISEQMVVFPKLVIPLVARDRNLTHICLEKIYFKRGVGVTHRIKRTLCSTMIRKDKNQKLRRFQAWEPWFQHH